MALSAVKNCLVYSKAIGSKSLFYKTTKSLISYGVQNSKVSNRSLYNLSHYKSARHLNSMVAKNALPYKCMCSYVHTKGDQELAAFLTDEIKNEKQTHASDVLPKLEGYECNLNGSDVELTKKLNGETITITANVNDSVDAEETAMDPNESKEPQDAEMKSKPDFTISILKGKKTLRFECSYSHDLPEEDAEAYNDSFQIAEIALFEGESNESTYCVSGDIMDGYLYDLLMNYLEERGISNEFADQLIAFFTQYEHQLYVNFLQGMKTFVEK
ncbi:complement component 1 Q subcomponent-binding protein, mitochondrial [Parasteatoda tepidariorum]|uniref:Complement component 1 Q subcomponent-binding protein, mitochondrial n=1 Tax=Parasteatoda tepidariorum TaxID=114398 RepID=A0A2L2XXA5_PARTP|nr:complement component 1 Q subcomponent-binding protein, mitochondrial [Parasteatoda tepidariorum]